jgi:NADH:ubiquinone oxidoreductase subunit F (NADH-binding)
VPSDDASVCTEKMAAPGEKSFCVLEYHTSEPVVTVQRAFRAKYAKGVCASRNQVVAH